MSLWGAENEKKPVWLTAEEKENCYATERGWVLKHANGVEEVLVAIANLNTRTGQTSLSSISVYAKKYTTGNKLNIKLSFNETIDLGAEYKVGLQFGENEEPPAAYSNQSTYNVGDKVENGGSYYKCITAVEEAEEFQAEKWEEFELATMTTGEATLLKGNNTSTVTFEYSILETNKGEVAIQDLTKTGFDLNGFEYPEGQESFPLKTGVYVNS